MKKAGIIFIVFFVLTLAVPAIACFVVTNGNEGANNELVNIFRACITQAVYCRLFL